MGKDKDSKKKRSQSQEPDGTGFQQLDVEMRLALKPYFLRNIDDGVHAEMSQNLFKYVPAFGGVVLGWWDVRYPDPSRSAAIFWEFPEVHVTVAMRVLLFAPFPDQRILGVVNSVGKDYVSLSVFGTWKAHIHAPDIPDEYRSHKFKEGDSVVFKVKQIQLDNHVMALAGSLDGIAVGEQASPAVKTVKNVEEGDKEEAMKPEKKEKKKEKEKEKEKEKKVEKSKETPSKKEVKVEEVKSEKKDKKRPREEKKEEKDEDDKRGKKRKREASEDEPKSEEKVEKTTKKARH